MYTAVLMLLAALASSTALAASSAITLDPQARYQRESAACSAIRSVDDRDNCQNKASTRLASTKPSFAEEHPDTLARNALKRCEPLPDPDRKDCVARMQGQGTTSGSVAGGGIYRELVTHDVGVAPAKQPAEPGAAK